MRLGPTTLLLGASTTPAPFRRDAANEVAGRVAQKAARVAGAVVGTPSRSARARIARGEVFVTGERHYFVNGTTVTSGKPSAEGPCTLKPARTLPLPVSTVQ